MDIKLCDDDESVYEIDGVRVPRVTGVIAEMLHTPFEKELFANMDVASLRGVIVHEFIDINGDRFFADNDPDHCGDKAEGYASERARWTHDDYAKSIAKDVRDRAVGWARFIQEEGFSTRASEFRVGIPYSYGGTVDRRGWTKTWGAVTLDIKPGLSPLAGLQLAAYVHAGANMQEEECVGMINDRRLVVALNPKFKRGYKAMCLDKVRVGYESNVDGMSAGDSLTYLEDRAVFLSALRVMNWKKKHGRLNQ